MYCVHHTRLHSCVRYAIYNMEDTNKTAVGVLCIIIVVVLSVIVTNCTVCDIMANPPEWIDSWYDYNGVPQEFFPTD